eukprot:4500441-Pyramimonas_sp.AAC.1
MLRGRWSSMRTAKIYIQDVAAILPEMRFQPATRSSLQTFTYTLIARVRAYCSKYPRIQARCDSPGSLWAASSHISEHIGEFFFWRAFRVFLEWRASLGLLGTARCESAPSRGPLGTAF